MSARPRVFAVVFAAAVIAPCAETAWADLIAPIAQDRNVSAQAQVETSEGSDFADAFDSAPDFGPYERTVTANATVTSTEALGRGSQNSRLEPNAILAAGAAEAITDDVPIGQTQAEGRSSFNVQFTITEEHSFLLSGSLYASEVSTPLGVATLKLKRIGEGLLYQASVDEDGRTIPVLFTGTFIPGDYELTVVASASAADGGASSAWYGVRLLVPEPGGAALAGAALLAALGLGRRRV